MALGLRCETLHQKDDNEAAEDRGQKHPVAKPAWSFADVGIVPDTESAVVKRVMKKSDERT